MPTVGVVGHDELVTRPLIGRRTELAALRAVLAGAAGGVPGVALIGGDAGAGKSRLLEELTDGARSDGWTVLVGNCVPIGDQGLPYLPIVDVLRQAETVQPTVVAEQAERRPALGALLPHLATASTGTEAGQIQGQLFEAILRLLTELARTGPVLMVIEDLHWADRSTRDLISFLARTARDGRIAVVASYRTDDLHRRHPLRPLVVELGRVPAVTKVDLPLLTRDEVADLVEQHTGAPADPLRVDELFRRTDGNAFYAEELLHAGASLPADLADLLLDRIGDLPDAARQVLRIAAVAGRRVDDALLTAVADLPRAELEQGQRAALEAGLLVVVRESAAYTFRHALLQEAVYEDLLPGERTRWHARFAEVLAGSDVDLAELAHHQLAAHQDEEALSTLVAAARRARELAAPTEAHRHLERALELVARYPQAQDREGLLREAAAAAFAAGDPRRAVSLATEVIAETERRSDAQAPDGIAARARAQERLAHYLMDVDGDPAEVPAARALDLVEQLPESELTARALATSARSLLWRDVVRSGELLQRTIEVADRVGAPHLAADAMASRALLVRRGIADGDSEQMLARAVARVGDDPAGAPVRVRALRFLTHVKLESETPAAALIVAEQGIELARESGLTWTAYGMDLHLLRGWALVAAGRWDEVLELARAAQYEPAANARLLGLLALEVLTQRRDPSAPALFARLRLVQDEFVQSQLDREELRLAARDGEHDKVLAAAPELADRVETFGATTEALLTQGIEAKSLGAVAAAAVIGGGAVPERIVARAVEVLARARRLADTPALSGTYGRMLLARVVAELGPVHGATDPRLWADVLDLARLAERIPERGVAAARLVEVSLDAGERGPDIVTLAAAARADLVGLGMTAEAERLDGLLQRARLSAGDPDRVPDLLTPRERQVLVLVAAGRSNGEIGRELFISTKTASVHVSNILAKVGASSRTEAAAMARRLGLLGSR